MESAKLMEGQEDTYKEEMLLFILYSQPYNLR